MLITGNQFESSINRNIVECKVEITYKPTGQKICINRNIVECKDGRNPGKKDDADVLIETLWNVKMVNIEILTFCRHGINRNIVECKDSF